MPARILIVDDDPDILSGLKKRLEWMGHDTVTAKDGVEALAAIQQEALSLVLLDLELPILSGIDVLERLNGQGKAAVGSCIPTMDAAASGNQILLRAERAGTGNGRVYQVHFTASDGQGGNCNGTVKVAVPHRKKDTAVEGPQLYNSFAP